MNHAVNNRGRGVTYISHDTRMCHYFGYFLRVLEDFRYFGGYSRISRCHLFYEILFSLGIIQNF